MTAPATDQAVLGAVLDAVEAQHGPALELLETLVAVPSTGGSAAEVEIQHLLADVLSEDGCAVELWPIDLAELAADPAFPGMEVERSEAYGLLATLPGHAPELGRSLLVDGHTDVVPPGDLDAWSGDPYALRREVRDGVEVLIGRGTCDMKGGLVAAVAALRAVRAAGVRLAGDLAIAPVVGEEDGGLGTFALMRHGVRADACIVPEPTDLDLVPANGGALTFRLHVRGRAVHASRRTEGVSAIELFLPVFEAVAGLEERRNTDVDPLVRRWPIAYPISIGTVHAGDWASTVPDLLVAEGRMGVALDEDPAAARADLEAAVAAACAAHPYLRTEPVVVQWWGGQFAPGRSLDEQWLARVRRAHAVAVPTWREPETYGAPYGSDLRLLAPHLPTVQYGPGDTRNAHAPDESITRGELEAATRVLAVLYLEHCGVV
ncbi:MAG TPA: ArgE/DapE family deacylase [Candidatus Nanopelagicales bacterium]|nr:ArgE/DapE family deacylase [Candidatus Nanopelagicales bacterium]